MKVSTFVDRTPASCPSRLNRVRAISPAPASSTSVSATSLTTSTRRIEAVPRDPALSRRISSAAPRTTGRAGRTLHKRPASIANASAPTSSGQSSSGGLSCGSCAAGKPQQAVAAPARAQQAEARRQRAPARSPRPRAARAGAGCPPPRAARRAISPRREQGPRGEQAGDVEARDHQQHGHGAEEHEQGARVPPDRRLLERRHRDLPAGVVGGSIFSRRAASAVISACARGDGHSRPQSRGDAQPARAAAVEIVGTEDVGEPDIDRGVRARKAETRRHDADHLARPTVDLERAADQRRDRRRSASARTRRSPERPAPAGSRSRRRPAAGRAAAGCRAARRSLRSRTPRSAATRRRLGSAGEGGVAAGPRHHLRERPGVAAPVEEVERRRAEAIDTARRVRADHSHQPVGFGRTAAGATARRRPPRTPPPPRRCRGPA